MKKPVFVGIPRPAGEKLWIIRGATGPAAPAGTGSSGAILWRRLWGRLGWWLAALGLLSLLGACSTLRFSYNQAPTLLYWQADRYADFSSGQSPVVRQSIQRFLAWHRRSQLPDYAALLAQARSDLAAPSFSAEQACRWASTLETRLDALIEPVLPEIAAWALVAQPAQLQFMAKRFDTNNEDFADEWINPSAAKLRKNHLKQWRNRYEDLWGPLSDEQTAALEAALSTVPIDAAAQLAERKLRQQDLLAVLRKVATPAAAGEPALTLAAAQALIRPALGLASPRPAYRQRAAAIRQAHCTLFAQVHQLATPEQRETAQTRLKGWEDDLRALVAEK